MQKAIKRYFPVFVLPTMIAFTIGFIAPFLLGIYLSFCKFTTVTDARFIGLENYGKVFQDPTFLHSLWYTVLFTVLSIILKPDKSGVCHGCKFTERKINTQ